MNEKDLLESISEIDEELPEFSGAGEASSLHR